MPQARIFCIGHNYAAHVKEMSAATPATPVVFMKPVTSIVPPGEPVPLPRGLGAIHHEMELVLRIGRELADADSATAARAIDAVTLGLDLTLRDLQLTLKAKGLPWERAKGFDHSAPMGTWTTLEDLALLGKIEMTCRVDDELRQHGSTADMLFSAVELVAFLSHHWRLYPGDMVFTGTPPGVGPLEPGQTVTIESPQIGRFTWTLI